MMQVQNKGEDLVEAYLPSYNFKLGSLFLLGLLIDNKIYLGVGLGN